MVDQDDVRAAVRRIGEALAADGYELTVLPEPAAPMFVVSARLEACEDCLVPRELLASMLLEELERAHITVDGPLRLTYPGDALR